MLGRNKKGGAKAPSILEKLEDNGTSYKVEKDIEIPYLIGSSPGRGPLYPFGSMKVKDSFFVDLETWKKRNTSKHFDKSGARRIDRLQGSLGSSARTYSQRNKQGKWRFTTRQQQTPVEGVRVWRIE